jgi:cell division protein ZapA
MSDEITEATIHIMDKEYRIACGQDEYHGLLESAKIVDRKMREIRDSSKVIGTDRIAVMAALNIAHELVDLKSNYNKTEDLQDRLKGLNQIVESSLKLEN